MIHPLNKQISTITSADIYPEAYLAVNLFIGNRLRNQSLPALGTHITVEDLAMDACEKVVRANPMYLTKSYVRMAARCVCIDKLKRKKLIIGSLKELKSEEDNSDTWFNTVEETIEGDITDYMSSLEEELVAAMNPLQTSIYKELLKNKMYLEISETLGISLRTLERQIQELKWLCEYLLTGIDPDDKGVNK